MGKFIDLPEALKPYAGLPIWVLYKVEPSKTTPGKFTKVPVPRQQSELESPLQRSQDMGPL